MSGVQISQVPQQALQTESGGLTTDQSQSQPSSTSPTPELTQSVITSDTSIVDQALQGLRQMGINIGAIPLPPPEVSVGQERDEQNSAELLRRREITTEQDRTTSNTYRATRDATTGPVTAGDAGQAAAQDSFFSRLKNSAINCWHAVKEFTEPVWRPIARVVTPVAIAISSAVTRMAEAFEAGFNETIYASERLQAQEFSSATPGTQNWFHMLWLKIQQDSEWGAKKTGELVRDIVQILEGVGKAAREEAIRQVKKEEERREDDRRERDRRAQRVVDLNPELVATEAVSNSRHEPYMLDESPDSIRHRAEEERRRVDPAYRKRHEELV